MKNKCKHFPCDGTIEKSDFKNVAYSIVMYQCNKCKEPYVRLKNKEEVEKELKENEQ